uniref:sodium- and chloride-dependent taurine transporter-like isoform X3 n=1 Tax=Myxine glutinosa TaxID=7769 RepID=UPI00358EFBCF
MSNENHLVQVVKEETKGEQWSNKLDFIFTMIGSLVGLGNVWRFPYLCYKNGGGAFLIPYFMFVLFCGIPLIFLELAVGQFTGQGGITCWTKMCPLFTGVGIGGIVCLSLSVVYYIVIMAWALFYLAYSFTNDLPWATCNHTWNTPTCLADTVTCNFTPGGNGTNYYNYTSPATEFWERKVLSISGGIDEVGELKWDLMLCLLAVWIILWVCLFKGVKTSGKIVYFTATFPLVILFILLVRGVTLPNAIYGIKYYLYPNLKRLGDAQVWLDAGTQVIFSNFIAFSMLPSLGSYNEYNYNCYKYVIIVGCINSCVSFISGLAIFSVLGFMAKEQGVDIATVAEHGPGLVFIVYPRAVAMMPLPGLWAVLFFIMLILLGIDSEFASVEGIMKSVLDRLQMQQHRVPFLTGIGIISFGIGLTMVTEGTLIYLLVDFKPLFYNSYEYPQWAQGVGWCLALASMLCVPLYALLRLLLADGPLYMRLKLLLKPEHDDLETWSRLRRGLPVVVTPDAQSNISSTDFKLTAL